MTSLKATCYISHDNAIKATDLIDHMSQIKSELNKNILILWKRMLNVKNI